MLALPSESQVNPAPPAGKITIKLSTGETMTGTVAGVKDQSVNLVTEYGVVRVPISKLTEEARKQLNIAPENEVAALKNRITELEALVASIREENASLRKGASTATQPLDSPSPSQEKTGNTSAEGTLFRLSNSGKRHNTRCRYYNSAGRACTATDGVACKVCGG